MIMWLAKPMLAPMMLEIHTMLKIAIQRSVQMTDIYETKDGNLRFAKGINRYNFLAKEKEPS